MSSQVWPLRLRDAGGRARTSTDVAAVSVVTEFRSRHVHWRPPAFVSDTDQNTAGPGRCRYSRGYSHQTDLGAPHPL